MTVVRQYQPRPRKGSTRRKILITLGLLLVAIIIFIKFYMASLLLDYVNNVLADMQGYSGHAESIDISLLEGAYKINGISIKKKAGKIPVPFFSADTIAFAVDWRALFPAYPVCCQSDESVIICRNGLPCISNNTSGFSAGLPR